MSNTDTNQASEDIVDSILSTLGIVDRESGNRPGQIQVVKQIIRTEKLKLLAEVRERVVGENEPNVRDGDYERFTINQLERLIPIRQRINYLRAEQRKALTKLEAEL